MNYKLELKKDSVIAQCLDTIYKNGYMTEEEKEQCFDTDIMPGELLETINRRIEIVQSPRTKCRSVQVLMLKGLSLYSLIN